MRQRRAAGHASALLALGLVLSLIGLGAMVVALSDRALVGAAFPMLVATPALGTATPALACIDATASRVGETPVDAGATPRSGRGRPAPPRTRPPPPPTRRIVQDALRRQRVESGYPRDMATIAQQYFWTG